MAGNRCVVYVEPGKVSVENIDYPKLELPDGVPGRNRNWSTRCAHWSGLGEVSLLHHRSVSSHALPSSIDDGNPP